MWNVFKMTGFSLTKGKFFPGGDLSMVIAAPQNDNYLGAVYVCKDCFDSNNRQDHITVSGLQMGEGFGEATAACDIDNDGFDDLIVGAPTYSENRRNVNVGRVHVFQNVDNEAMHTLTSVR